MTRYYLCVKQDDKMHVAYDMPSDTASASVVRCILLAVDTIILPRPIAESRAENFRHWSGACSLAPQPTSIFSGQTDNPILILEIL